MALSVTCPGCGTTYKNVNPQKVGMAARCKKCGKKFRITSPPVKAATGGETIPAPVKIRGETTQAMDTSVHLVDTATVLSESSRRSGAPETLVSGRARTQGTAGTTVFKREAAPSGPGTTQMKRQTVPARVSKNDSTRLSPQPRPPGTLLQDSGDPGPARTVRRAEKSEVNARQTVYAGKVVNASDINRAAQDVAFDWQIGETILGLYKVTGMLGEGGMGRVYKVEHLGWNMELAVKTPKQELMAIPGGAEDFVREAETWVNLGLHPNLVSCYYVRSLGGIPRVFAEYVEGGSLSEWIRTKKLYKGGSRAVLARILDTAIQSAWGLHFGHEQGIVHQDMKPANVMMTRDGTAKITDFGLARARTSRSDAHVPDQPGHTMFAPGAGAYTPLYASPEQVHGLAISRKSDIWNWAAGIVEMFAGDTFWASGLAVGEFFREFTANWSPDEIAPRPPDLLVKLLKRCFQPAPEDRPADMKYIVRVLTRVFKEEIGKNYPRTEPKRGLATGDILNNKAMSLLDLGKMPEALKAWNEALTVQPYHPQATYNRGLIRRRLGSIDDASLIKEVEDMAGRRDGHWRAQYLIALVFLELAHYQPALKLLESVSEVQPHERDVRQALDLARQAVDRLGRHTGQFSEGTDMPHVLDYHAPLMMSRFQESEKTYRYRAEFEEHMMMGRAALDAKKAPLAANHVRKARSVPGCRVNPSALELWGKLCRILPRKRVEGGWEKQSLKGHEGPVIGVDISMDGSRAVSLGRDGALKHWDLKKGTCIKTIVTSSGDEASVRLSHKGYHALIQSDRTFRIWNLTTGELNGTFEAEFLGLDGKLLGHVAGRCLTLQDPASHSTVDTVELPGGRSFCLSQDGQLVFSVHDDTIAFTDHKDGNTVRVLEAHDGGILSLALNPAGTHLVSTGSDRSVKLWAIESGRRVLQLQAHREAVTCSCVSLNGGYIVSGSSDKTIKIWELDNRQCVATLQGHEDTVTCVALSLDGLTAISGGSDGAVKIWALDWELEDVPCSASDRRLDPYLHEFVSGEGRFRRPAGSGSATKSPSAFRGLLYVLACAGFGALEPEALKQRIRRMPAKWMPVVRPESVRKTEVPVRPIPVSADIGSAKGILDAPSSKSSLGLVKYAAAAAVLLGLIALGVSVMRESIGLPGTKNTGNLEIDALQAGVRVSLSIGNGPYRHWGTTGADGRVLLKGVRAGAFIVIMLEKEGFRTRTTHFNFPVNAVGKTHVLPPIRIRPD